MLLFFLEQQQLAFTRTQSSPKVTIFGSASQLVFVLDTLLLIYIIITEPIHRDPRGERSRCCSSTATAKALYKMLVFKHLNHGGELKPHE